MKKIGVIIVIAQFFCTSLWFAGNAIVPDIAEVYQFSHTATAWLTSAVQLGFIVGTLLFAVYSLADRYSPSRVFFISALVAALFNLVTVLLLPLELLLSFRFAIGFFLAGIYPVGMKIAADHYQKGLGATLGFLVGALVLGTAFPHLVRAYLGNIQWEVVIYITSSLSVVGGILIFLLVADGPYRKASPHFNFKLIFSLFRKQDFRSAAFGYFGHMWELYTFWTFVPLLVAAYFHSTEISAQSISAYSFMIIASGSIACGLAGYLSLKFQAKKLAQFSLLISGLCCLIFPFALHSANFIIFIAFMLIWSMSVIADSPMFSTLVAQRAPQENRATALTIVNSIGFAITIVSISVMALLIEWVELKWAVLMLVIGPVFGLISISGTKKV